MNLGAVYRAADRLADAVASLREAIRLDPRSWSAHYNLAAALAASRDWEAAEASCGHALQLHPGDAETLSLLGFILPAASR
jgi:cytochrome c-type biogenesis protein CcmH/NrfG